MFRVFYIDTIPFNCCHFDAEGKDGVFFWWQQHNALLYIAVESFLVSNGLFPDKLSGWQNDLVVVSAQNVLGTATTFHRKGEKSFQGQLK